MKALVLFAISRDAHTTMQDCYLQKYSFFVVIISILATVILLLSLAFLILYSPISSWLSFPWLVSDSNWKDCSSSPHKLWRIHFNYRYVCLKHTILVHPCSRTYSSSRRRWTFRCRASERLLWLVVSYFRATRSFLNYRSFYYI